MAGFVAGFDGDTPESIVSMADQLMDIGVDVPFLSVLTPYRGTPLYDQLVEEGRLLEDRGMAFYNGYNVAFQPKLMSPGRVTACAPGVMAEGVFAVVRIQAYMRGRYAICVRVLF